MKNTTRIHALKIMTLGAAVPGFLLRSYLYASAVDQKGLIISGHWATRALVGLTLLFLAGLLLLIDNPKQELEYQGIVLDGHNDHRIVMAMSIVLSEIGGSIEGTEAVRKSYPGFFTDIKRLGAEVELK